MQKVAVITGASGGIGAAIAADLARDYRVALGYHNNREKAEECVTSLHASGLQAYALRVDVADGESVSRFAAEILAREQHVDVLVSCAGIAASGLVTGTDDALWHTIMDTNVTGTFFMCRAFLPAMIRQQSGIIVNMSSIWGITGASCEVAYSASKAAVIGLTKALAKEVAPSGITVNCVAPGYIETEMNAALSAPDKSAFFAETPLGRAGTAEEVAHAVRFLTENRFVTGQVISPNGGYVI